MANRNIIGVGGSSGSTDVLKTLLGAIPAGTDACIFVTTHIPRQGEHLLAQVLARASALPLEVAQEGARVVAKPYSDAALLQALRCAA